MISYQNFVQLPLAVKTMTLLKILIRVLLLIILYPIGFKILLIIVAMIHEYLKERPIGNDVIFYQASYTFFFITVVVYWHELYLSYSDS